MKSRFADKKIGVFGFGCVGQGLYDVVEACEELGLEIVKICVKDRQKPRALPASVFTFDPQELLTDNRIDVLVELISNADEAYELVKQALLAGKTVVSANKKMVAEHLPELVKLQQEHGGVLLYEASVCGSIPIIRMLEAYYGTEPLQEVSGILNGSSNYILHKLASGGLSYGEALAQAQELGFAEADPSLDVQGIDALNKLCIVAAHAFGVFVHPNEVLRFGIQHITKDDIALAGEVGAVIKLVGTARWSAGGKLVLQVLPTFVPQQRELYHVNAEFNAVEVEPAFAGKQLLKGRGAGSHPTGSAVWADVAAALTGYRYTYAKLLQNQSPALDKEAPVRIYVRAKLAALVKLPWLIIESALETGEESIVVGQIKQKDMEVYQPELEEKEIFVAEIPAEINVEDFSKIIPLDVASVV
ncbi:homoserine dehydrogenase [Pontibacter sp. SGAir0037]|uniref:homoserine dehydrogenase n=1 Tax=Pontibacter sp. SGAir0037 TaxID=2571030 RepID=UPI0010CCC365|nr:homoserine dehydrogenase [Pontibacter sp. SGAir0037]QCR21413.1 homoserine dehydrogenase [Pontibacter sp. SGAir0037]